MIRSPRMATAWAVGRARVPGPHHAAGEDQVGGVLQRAPSATGDQQEGEEEGHDPRKLPGSGEDDAGEFGPSPALRKGAGVQGRTGYSMLPGVARTGARSKRRGGGDAPPRLEVQLAPKCPGGGILMDLTDYLPVRGLPANFVGICSRRPSAPLPFDGVSLCRHPPAGFSSSSSWSPRLP